MGKQQNLRLFQISGVNLDRKVRLLGYGKPLPLHLHVLQPFLQRGTTFMTSYLLDRSAHMLQNNFLMNTRMINKCNKLITPHTIYIYTEHHMQQMLRPKKWWP